MCFLEIIKIGHNAFERQNIRQIDLNDNLTILHGRHMMKTGFMFMRQQFNWYDSAGGILGSMSYGGVFTSGPHTSAPISWEDKRFSGAPMEFFR